MVSLLDHLLFPQLLVILSPNR